MTHPDPEDSLALRRLRLALERAVRELAHGFGMAARDMPHALPILRDLVLAAWHDRAALERQRVREAQWQRVQGETGERKTAVPPPPLPHMESVFDERRTTPVEPVDDLDRTK